MVHVNKMTARASREPVNRPMHSPNRTAAGFLASGRMVANWEGTPKLAKIEFLPCRRRILMTQASAQDGRRSVSNRLDSLYDQYLANPDTHSESFCAAVLSFVSREQPDEDQAASVMLKLLENIGSYTNHGKLENWIRTIIRNAELDLHRKKKEDLMEQQDLERLQIKTPARTTVLDLRVIKDPIDRMICEAIRDGLSRADAAESCGMSESGVRKRLAHLRTTFESPATLILS